MNRIILAILLIASIYANPCLRSFAETQKHFGPVRTFGYDLYGLMEPEDVPEYKIEHVEPPYTVGHNGFGDPRVLCVVGWPWSKDQILKHTYNKEVVEEIQMNGVVLSEAELEFMTSVPHLTRVMIAAYRPECLTQSMLKALATNSSLRHLKIRADLSRLDLSVLKNLHNLCDLQLLEPHLTPANVSQLGTIKSLLSLELEDLPKVQIQFRNMTQLQSVQELRLNGGTIAGVDLAFLRTLPNLQRLELRVQTDATAIDQVLASGRNLRDVVLPTVTDGDLAKLRALSHLQGLDAGSDITGETLILLKNLPLKYLSLGNSALSRSGLHQLLLLRNLKGLALSGTDLSDQDIESLAALTSLRRLRLTCMEHASEAGPAQLSKSLPNCSILFSRDCEHF